MELCIENLSVHSRDRIIIDDVSLRLCLGQSLSLVGPSGAGKTTLVKIILGIARNYFLRGTISYAGIIMQRDQRVLVPPSARRFGYIPQELALWPHLSVEQTISLSLKLAGRASSTRKDNLLKHCGLSHLISQFPHTLSGGEKQRLALARALAGNPQLLVLDEPFSALDLPAKSRLMALIKELQTHHNFSLIVISHDLVEAMHMSSHMALLDRGKLQWLKECSSINRDSFPEHWNPFLSPLWSKPLRGSREKAGFVDDFHDAKDDHIIVMASGARPSRNG